MRLHGSDGPGTTGRGWVGGLLVVLAAYVLLGAAAASLFDLAETGTPEQLRQALKGADVNAVDAVGRTVLMHAAAYNPDPAVITVLVKAGAKVNSRGPAGWTALMMAAYSNPNPAVVEALLTAGANGKLKSDPGYTAFSYAQENDKLKGTPVYEKLRSAAR
jgi:ankyrin repeat protein